MIVEYFEDYSIELVKHMAKGHSFFSFAGVIGVSREMLIRWGEQYKEFDYARKVGMEKSLLFWEEVMMKCATGQERANTAMIQFKMRNTYKELYGDSVKVEHGGGITITIDTGIQRPQAIEAESKVIDKLEEIL